MFFARRGLARTGNETSLQRDNLYMPVPNRKPSHLDDIWLWLNEWFDEDFKRSLDDLLKLDEDTLGEWPVKFIDSLRDYPVARWSKKQRQKIGEIWYARCYE
jgi:hypothetical protein